MDHRSKKKSTSIEDADGNTFAEVIDLIQPEDIDEAQSDWKASGVYKGPDRKEYVKQLLAKRKAKKEGKKMDEQSNLGEGKKKGLWDNIHAKRKRGEKPAKKGDKDYPETLDIGEGMKTARDNVGADKCWDGYKAKGTKKKGGKEVPNCVKEDKKTFSQFCAEAEEKKMPE